jgi:UDP-glucose 4-epimerase
MKVLVTGGAGYIGSATCLALSEAGHTPIILDSLVNGRIEYTRDYTFYEGDIADRALLERIFEEQPDIDCCIHFAARIIVPESVADPFFYYTENVAKSLRFFKDLEELGCHRVVFSSSASIYGYVPGFIVDESAPKNPSSPYARTKYMMEMILEDLSNATQLRGIALRYFNPIGAEPGMRVGPYDKHPTHVVANMVKVVTGEAPVFTITGVDWPTRDGSGIRDYIHIWDLALAHVAAVENFDSALEKMGARYLPINLGTGDGVTVKELVAAFEEVYGKQLNKAEAGPRPGDVAGCYADPTRAKELLGWQTHLSIADAIRDVLRWTNEERVKVLGY